MERTLTPAEAAAVGGAYGVALVFILIWYALIIIAGWKIFKKAGEPGWKSLIPIYNVYILYKIAGIKKWFWIMIAVACCIGFINGIISATAGPDGNTAISVISAFSTIFGLGVNAYYSLKMSKAFKHGIAFAIGLFIFEPIFMLILGFGASKYDKKVLK